ncbi:MAG: hypothetical protein JW874_01980 [Spirochaetales bacterium]|nr:hypothetical protein [Spirochaetales bacterium]
MKNLEDFNTTVNDRIVTDKKFAAALLDEAVELFLNGESTTARLVLRNLVNSAIGFEVLSTRLNIPAKSLHRMLSANGNPTMDNLTRIISELKNELHVNFKIETVPA